MREECHVHHNVESKTKKNIIIIIIKNKKRKT